MYTPKPEFTSCFRETALVWGPCFMVWIFGVVQMLSLINNRRPSLELSTLHFLKLVRFRFKACISLHGWHDGISTNLHSQHY